MTSIARHRRDNRLRLRKSRFKTLRFSYYLTYRMLQPIHLVCIDGRTQNLYVLAGQNEEVEFEVTPNGEVL